MLIARNKKEARQIANAYDQELLDLEKSFTKLLKSLFVKINRDFEYNYVYKSKLIDIEEDYKEDLYNILLEQYKKTYKRYIKVFAGDKGRVIKLECKEETLFENEEDEDELEALLLLYFIPLAERQSKVINKTTQKSIKAHIQRATRDLISEGIEPTKKVVSDLILPKLESEGIVRSSVISQVETGHAWSYTGEEAGKKLVQKQVARKMWVAELDDKTRPAHVVADGQTQEYSDFFLVGGELLMFPRDYTNGSIENTINCRCNSVPFME